MSNSASFLKTNPGDKTVQVVAGQHHKFMLIPIMEEETTWFSAGPVRIGVESRAFGTPDGRVLERGPSVHVLDATTNEEWLRFDCFDNEPHYHYILQAFQHNIVWGYDPAANGPMFDWTIQALEEQLSGMLRKAGADVLADKVEREGFDSSVLDKVREEMVKARKRTFPGTDMIQPSIDWYNRWKELHPRFNTVDY